METTLPSQIIHPPKKIIPSPKTFTPIFNQRLSNIHPRNFSCVSSSYLHLRKSISSIPPVVYLSIKNESEFSLDRISNHRNNRISIPTFLWNNINLSQHYIRIASRTTTDRHNSGKIADKPEQILQLV